MTPPPPLSFHIGRIVALLAVATLGLPRALDAQAYTCDRAAQQLLSDSSSQHDLSNALAKIVDKCHENGAHVILELRRRAVPGSARDTLALQGLWAMADSRMADSLLALASDPRQPMTDRLLYLRVLTHYADCDTYLDVSNGEHDGDTDAGVLSSVIDGCGIYNEQRYSDSDRARIRAGFAWIGTHDSDVKLARLARLAAQQLVSFAALRDSIRRERHRTPR